MMFASIPALLTSALLVLTSQVGVQSSVQQTAPVEIIRPMYPQDAIENHVAGTVVLEATVAKDGSIESLRAISGPMELRKDSLRAVAMWRYAPQLTDGQPADTQRTIRIRYTLGDAKSVPTADADLVIGTEQESPQLSLVAKAAPLPPGRVRLFGYKADAVVVQRVEPTFPVEAKKNGIPGSVLVHVVIDKTGKAIQVDAVKGSGAAMFVPSAEEAIKQWTFRPYLVDGVPTEVDAVFNVNFQ